MKRLSNLAYISFIAFAFFLPYVKIGLIVGLRTFSISDFALLLSFSCVCINIIANNFGCSFNKEFRIFLIIQSLFLFLLSLSGFNVPGIRQYLNAIAPHVYALILTFTFGYLYSYYKSRFLIDLQKALLVTTCIAFVPIVFKARGLNMYLFLSRANKYTFLCNNPNQFGVFVGTALSISLMTYLIRPDKGRIKDMLASLFILTAFIVILFTGSRTASIYIFLILLSYLFYYFVTVFRARHFTLQKLVNRFVYFFLFIAIIGLASLVAYTRFTNLPERFKDVRRSSKVVEYIKEKRLDEPRGSRLRRGWRIFKENYLLGIGFGNYYNYYHGYEIHSTYISLLAETGILGFCGFLLLIGFLIERILNTDVDFASKSVFINLFIAFLIINIPHYFLRERWVWLYFQSVVAISTIGKNAEGQRPAA